MDNAKISDMIHDALTGVLDDMKKSKMESEAFKQTLIDKGYTTDELCMLSRAQEYFKKGAEIYRLIEHMAEDHDCMSAAKALVAITELQIYLYTLIKKSFVATHDPEESVEESVAEGLTDEIVADMAAEAKKIMATLEEKQTAANI